MNSFYSILVFVYSERHIAVNMYYHVCTLYTISIIKLIICCPISDGQISNQITCVKSQIFDNDFNLKSKSLILNLLVNILNQISNPDHMHITTVVLPRKPTDTKNRPLKIRYQKSF